MKITELANHRFGDYNVVISSKSGFAPVEDKDTGETKSIMFSHTSLMVDNQKWREPIVFGVSKRHTKHKETGEDIVAVSFSDSREKTVKVKTDLWGRKTEMRFEAGRHKYISAQEMKKYLDKISNIPGVGNAILEFLK